MWRQRIRCCAICSLAAIVCTSARGEQIEYWPYDRLFKESDSVLIVTFESTAEQKKLLDNPVGREELHLVITKLKVVNCVKGEIKSGDTIDIRHWRLDKGVRLGRLPAPILWEKSKNFQIGDSAFTVELNYMVFLRKGRSGDYELTTGVLNGVESVKELLPPTNPNNRP